MVKGSGVAGGSGGVFLPATGFYVLAERSYRIFEKVAG